MKILILSARSFGDCIITLELIKYLSFKKDIEIDIFTKREFLTFFQNNKNINNLFVSTFPIGANAKFSLLSLLKLFKKCVELRGHKYDIVLNNIGDFRENFIGFLTSKNKNISIEFTKNHPFGNLIRKGFKFLVNQSIKIPDDVLNVYDMQKYISHYITNQDTSTQHIQDNNNRELFAIHPTASQECRMWPFVNWIELIKLLDEKNIIIFCTPNEKDKIQTAFSEVKDKIQIVATNLDGFLKQLESVETLICLDSFAQHAAYYKNVKNIIMLNGANDFRIWSSPKTKVVKGIFNCTFYPCYNKPKCIGKDFEYSCINSISVEDVIKATNE